VSGQLHASAALPPEKKPLETVVLYKELVRPRTGVDDVKRKISLLLGIEFGPPAVQPILRYAGS
jgi:hypothetical protein